MAKHIERTQQTKEKLVEAFWELYCENKIEKITIKSITDKAGFYRSTFYEYFSDVYGVLEDIETGLLNAHRGAMEEIIKANNFEEAKELSFNFCKDNAKYLAVLLGPNGDPKFISAVKEHISKCIREVLHIDSSRLDVQVTLQMVSGAIISVLTYWYQHQDTVAIEDVFGEVVKFVQGGAFSLIKDLNIPFFKA